MQLYQKPYKNLIKKDKITVKKLVNLIAAVYKLVQLRIKYNKMQIDNKVLD